jgi:hypothetical protein
MRLARVLMDLQETKLKIDNGDKWENHRISLRNTFNKNSAAYIGRIKDIVSICIDEKIEMLILPACTLFYTNIEDYEKYLKLFTNIPIVYTGVLQQSTKSYKETANMICNGKVISDFDIQNIHIDNYKNYYFISAISSTIKEINELSSEDTSIPKKNNVVIVDMGHHQYNGRYMRTLNSVTRHIKNEYNIVPFTALSFWKFKNAAINADWFVSEKNIGFKRLIRNNDFIDIMVI